VFRQHWFSWPAQVEGVLDLIKTASRTSDVYVSPYVMATASRAKGNAVEHRLVHCDVDREPFDEAKHAKLRQLGGFAVASGSDGHAHPYVRLTESVSTEKHERLCRELAIFLGGADPAKCSDNDLLRPPCTLNHKTKPAQPVSWLVEPTEATISPRELADVLGVDLDHPEPKATKAKPKASTNGQEQQGHPVDLTRYPTVQTALTKVYDPPDRSAHAHGVMRACHNAGLTSEQARRMLRIREDLAGWLDENPGDEVARSWDKFDEEDEQDDQIRHAAHLGKAVKLAEQFADRLLYVNGIGWHHWDGNRFGPDGDGAAYRAVHRMLRRERRIISGLQLSDEDRERRNREIARYETASAISGILAIAATLQAFSVTVDDMDADPWLFNCANGTLDLRTAELRPHDPADRITKVANAAYHKDATSVTWDAFVKKVLPEEDVLDYVQRLIGVSLLGEVNGDKQIQAITYGSGANGKSTFNEAVCFAMGDYAKAADPKLLMARRSDSSHSTEIADLVGKRLVTAVETEKGGRFDLARMTWLTGGERINARHLYQKSFEFNPSHLLLLATNHLPDIDDGSEAVWRRIRVIPFTVQIPEEEREPDLNEQLRADADAVLAWAVAGWTDYRSRGGLAAPNGVLLATKEYRADSDAVGQFIADECETGSQFVATTKELYDAWKSWAAANDRLPTGKREFGRDLDDKGHECDQKRHGWPRLGIRLRAQKVQVDG
jgi:putative DNA primase/helicase